jgi:hypothetical protein
VCTDENDRYRKVEREAGEHLEVGVELVGLQAGLERSLGEVRVHETGHPAAAAPPLSMLL